jgi:hypothetical protein
MGGDFLAGSRLCLGSCRGGLSKTPKAETAHPAPGKAQGAACQSAELCGPRLPQPAIGHALASHRCSIASILCITSCSAVGLLAFTDRPNHQAPSYTTNSRAGIMNDLHPLGGPPICYFTLPVSTSHYSDETPQPTSPQPEYSSDTWASSTNPLLAHRSLPMASASADASHLLQLQTQAAHRPSTQPLQPNGSPSPSNSDSSMSSQRSSISMSPSNPLCCCRCRRESHGHSGMFQFGTNLYYCSHCAKMVGYSAG